MIEPRITMMTTDSATSISGRVVLNGAEWVIKTFEVQKGMSASEKEKALVKRAISEWRARLDARESGLMDWVGVGNE